LSGIDSGHGYRCCRLYVFPLRIVRLRLPGRRVLPGRSMALVVLFLFACRALGGDAWRRQRSVGSRSGY
jgi:hypothetical protein